ncbi:hypothetical protein Q666_04405 [Marinobacter sp. ES-1]|nr:hypothetical protein Q666_04405 [Marinobacter sp. ES-1]
MISKAVVQKKYGELTESRFEQLHGDFCRYFGCC